MGIRRPYQEKSCVHCGQPFGPHPQGGGYNWSSWDKAKFCGFACRDAHRRALRKPATTKACEHCGSFYGPRTKSDGCIDWRNFHRSKFCSPTCSGYATAKRRSVRTKPCALCGTLFGPKPIRRNLRGRVVERLHWGIFDKARFCSKRCSVKMRHAPTREVAQIAFLTGLPVSTVARLMETER